MNRDKLSGRGAGGDSSPDPICALYEEWLEIRDHIRITTDDAKSAQLCDQMDRLETRICHTMATGPDGLECQLRWLRESLPHGTTNDQREIVLLSQIQAGIRLLWHESNA
ncbi:MAG TPA: hypothetical protein DCS82_02595 [Rhodospirillaceae bacterium]|nr:hypothetical protein [Rhodospirillaceae bacterium]HAT34578.1 hypothetical protein [Rhodospirillaceae bacterium]